MRLGAAIQENKVKKRILREKAGRHIVTAYDERRRQLVVCGVDDLKVCHYSLSAFGEVEIHLQSSITLNSFFFDETHTHLSSQGSMVNLGKWYSELPKIRSLLFISGSDEVAIAESGGRVRVFSLVSQNFRSVN